MPGVIAPEEEQDHSWDNFKPHYKTNARNCGLCSHQGVCSAFMLFKTQVEPAIMDQKSSLKAENLAWMCNLYEDKELKK